LRFGWLRVQAAQRVVAAQAAQHASVLFVERLLTDDPVAFGMHVATSSGVAHGGGGRGAGDAPSEPTADRIRRLLACGGAGDAPSEPTADRIRRLLACIVPIAAAAVARAVQLFFRKRGAPWPFRCGS
jgi:hypothetical protein